MFINYLASFIIVITSNTLTFTTFISLRTYILVDKSSTASQFPLNLPQIIMNG